MKTIMIYSTIFIDMAIIIFCAIRADKEHHTEAKIGFVLVALIFVFNIIAILV